MNIFEQGKKLPADDLNENFEIVVGRIKSFFGTGKDGNVVLSENTTLKRDMHYENLTIEEGVVFNPNGYRVFVKFNLVNNGIIRRNGNDGGDGGYNKNNDYTGFTGGVGGVILANGSIRGASVGGTGGAGKAASNSSGTWTEQYATGSGGGGGANENPALASINGSKGGDSGASSAGSVYRGIGGSGGTSTKENIKLAMPDILITTINNENVFEFLNTLRGITSGKVLSNLAGSGGGAGGSFQKLNYQSPYIRTVKSGAGGGAGSGGGLIYIQAQSFVNNGVIEAIGGNGGNGSNAYRQYEISGDSAGGGGGGAGGNGGCVVLMYENFENNGSIDLSAGVGGSGGSGVGGFTNGGSGANGNVGAYFLIKINQ